MSKFLILGYGWKNYKRMFGDILGLSNVYYYDDFIETAKKRFGMLARVHLSTRLNAIFPLPFRQYWLNRLIREHVILEEDQELYVIVFPWNSELLKHWFVHGLKTHHSQAKFICYLTDSLSVYNFNISKVKSEFDLIITADKRDSEMYGLVYYQGPYSELMDSTNDFPLEIDVFFVGVAKRRLQLIIDIYWLLVNNGLKCEFYVPDIEELLKSDGLGGINAKRLDYDEVIRKVKCSRCILEIVEPDGRESLTTRYSEALVYGKYLLSNSKLIKNAIGYNERYMQYFEKPEDINLDMLRSEYMPEYNYCGELSPIRFLEFIRNIVGK